MQVVFADWKVLFCSLGELYLGYTMPKGKKKSVNLNVPYSVSKKSSGDQEHDKEDALLCDSCKLQVDQVIQCEHCELWFCATCESIPAYVMDIISYCTQADTLVL